MGKLSKRESAEYARVKRLSKGTKTKISRVPGTSNVKISRRGSKPIYRQLGGNVGLSATSIVSARRRLSKRR